MSCYRIVLFFYIFMYYFFLQFDEPSEDLTEFVVEEEAGFKG